MMLGEKTHKVSETVSINQIAVSRTHSAFYAHWLLYGFYYPYLLLSTNSLSEHQNQLIYVDFPDLFVGS